MTRARRYVLAVLATLALSLSAVALPASSFAGETLGQKHKNHDSGSGGGVETAEEDPGLEMEWLYISLGVAALVGAAGAIVLEKLGGADP